MRKFIIFSTFIVTVILCACTNKQVKEDVKTVEETVLQDTLSCDSVSVEKVINNVK